MQPQPPHNACNPISMHVGVAIQYSDQLTQPVTHGSCVVLAGVSISLGCTTHGILRGAYPAAALRLTIGAASGRGGTLATAAESTVLGFSSRLHPPSCAAAALHFYSSAPGSGHSVFTATHRWVYRSIYHKSGPEGSSGRPDSLPGVPAGAPRRQRSAIHCSNYALDAGNELRGPGQDY